MTPSFSGIIPPMITPLRDRDALDRPGLECLVERLIAGKVSGIFVLGTMGEGPGLSHRLRRELIEHTCRQVNGRMPVLVGISDTSFVESLEVARWAAEAGARAVVLTPPYYFPAAQSELSAYVRRLTEQLPLPLFLYNIPSMTKVGFSVETIRQLADNQRIVGVKDSSGDMAYFTELLAVAGGRPDWSVLMGNEAMLAEAVAIGAHGGVTGGANIDPQLFVRLYDAAVRRDVAQVTVLHDRVLKLGQVYRVNSSPSSPFRGLKCSLSWLGVCSDFMAEPLCRFEGADREKIRHVLQELELLPP
jgi:4-hydroxy-tetrahydrodipicolinate synthase